MFIARTTKFFQALIIVWACLCVSGAGIIAAAPSAFAQAPPPPGPPPTPSGEEPPSNQELTQWAENNASKFACYNGLSGGLPGGNGILNLPMCIAWGTYTLMWISSALLYYTGTAFNLAITHTVVKMGANVDGLPGINSAWSVLRDFGNLIFVFALLVIGIATILRVSSYGYKTLLKSVIIGALLINFSLLFGKVIIDFSNLLATAMYDRIVASPTGASVCSTTNLTTITNVDTCVASGDSISAKIMAQLKLNSLQAANSGGSIFDNLGTIAVGGAGTPGGGTLSPANKIILISVFGTIFILITSFVLLAGTVLLVIRYVVLIFLLILSPIAFAGMALPQTKGYAKEWWNKMLAQAFFAPAFLLMMLVSLTVLSTPMFTGVPNSTFADALLNLTDTGVNGALGIVLNFILVMGLMVLSLITAAKLGAYGANTAIKMGKGLAYAAAGTAAAYSVGRAAGGARWVYDRAAAGAQEDIERMKQTRSGRVFLNTLKVGNIAARTAAAAATAGGSEALYRGARTTVQRSIPAALKDANERKYFGTVSYTEEAKKDRERAKEVKAVRSEMDTEQAAYDLSQAVRRASRDPGYNFDADEKVQKALTKIKSLSNSEVERLVKDGKIGEKDLATITPHLTPTQVETILSSKDVGDSDKASVRKARYGTAMDSAVTHSKTTRTLVEKEQRQAQLVRDIAALNPADRNYATQLAQLTRQKDAVDNEITDLKDTRNTAEATIKKVVKDLSPGELESLALSGTYTPTQLAEIAPHLNGDQWEKLKKSDKLPQSFKDILTNEGRLRGFMEMVNTSDDSKLGEQLKKTNLGDVPKDILDRIMTSVTVPAPGAPAPAAPTFGDQFILALTKKNLSDLQKANKLDPAQRATIKQILNPTAAARAGAGAHQAASFFNSGPGQTDW